MPLSCFIKKVYRLKLDGKIRYRRHQQQKKNIGNLLSTKDASTILVLNSVRKNSKINKEKICLNIYKEISNSQDLKRTEDRIVVNSYLNPVMSLQVLVKYGSNHEHLTKVASTVENQE